MPTTYDLDQLRNELALALEQRSFDRVAFVADKLLIHGRELASDIPDMGHGGELLEAVIATGQIPADETTWTVPKIAHDEDRPVGPHVRGRMIHRAAGQSDPDHTRFYAAQLLAAADAAEAGPLINVLTIPGLPEDRIYAAPPTLDPHRPAAEQIVMAKVNPQTAPSATESAQDGTGGGTEGAGAAEAQGASEAWQECTCTDAGSDPDCPLYGKGTGKRHG